MYKRQENTVTYAMVSSGASVAENTFLKFKAEPKEGYEDVYKRQVQTKLYLKGSYDQNLSGSAADHGVIDGTQITCLGGGVLSLIHI